VRHVTVDPAKLQPVRIANGQWPVEVK
jgi:hypothetical protein